MEKMRKKLLVITSTFPRWKNDAVPMFVYEFSNELAKKGFDVHVLAPHYKGAKEYERMCLLKVHKLGKRFRSLKNKTLKLMNLKKLQQRLSRNSLQLVRNYDLNVIINKFKET